jgi:adenosylcobinamide kinase/adenosylcobinamide-phosphate guanylyltransferase
MQDSLQKHVTLVLGGVRSGKSRYAQELAAQADRVTFVATAERRDDAEMIRKIDRHRSERPSTWRTIEEPIDLAGTLYLVSPDTDVILVDCLTLFVSNLIEVHGEDSARLDAQIDALYVSLHAAPQHVILVSNEVGSGVVPSFALGRQFRDFVGEVNQRIAALADTVIFMVAGLPIALKGVISMQVPR